jgi:acyl carrier protein
MSNTEKDKRFDELVSYIRDKSGVHDMPITRDTLIEDDLGVTGDDAYELITGLSKIYAINIKDFEFGRYFNDEPSIFISSKSIEPFTVGHLEKAITAERLDEEIINT